jgi:hypothetical protein
MIGSVRRLQWRPAVREQFIESTGSLRREALKDVFEIPIRIVSYELGGLDEAHDRSGALAGAQRSCEEPVASAESYRTDTVFDLVVVDR